MEKDWILITGQPIDTTKGGGFEFFGPYTEEEAMQLRDRWVKLSTFANGETIVLAVQLLKASVRT